MAATPFELSHAAANLFDIYNDAAAAAARNDPSSPLPGGACNFVDLTPGANGSRCGCRRFWTRQTLGSPVPDQAGWCMCNHHACYHDHGSRDAHPFDASPNPNINNNNPNFIHSPNPHNPHNPHAPGQENEKPRTGRAPLSPMVDVPLDTPSAFARLDFPSFDNGPPISFVHNRPHKTGFGTGMAPSPQPAGSMPDTLAWADGMQTQNDNGTMPPIPPQCLMPSQTASTTSSAQARYLRPFAGKGLQTLNTARGDRPRPRRQDNTSQHTAAPHQEPRGVDESFVLVPHNGTPVSRPGTASQGESRAANADTVTRECFKNLADTVGDHAQRLDRLETVSFSGAGHDECYDKHDHMDLRMTDLESKMEEVEKAAQDNAAVAHRGDQNDDATTQSVVSFATTATSRPTHSQEIWSQLQSLQAQVTHLQSSVPSPGHAWEVEVVFLPFPLKKIWQDIDQFRTDSATSSDDWTQLPMTHSSATLRSQSPFMGDWATGDHDAEWLLPKACGDKSVTDKRLRSRGLIKTVSVRSPDARSVQTAINAAFDGVFREMQLAARTQGSDPRLSRFLGLHSNWVPLRKIHKDSRLRFLGPGEMLTPAMWDVQFLNSVMMRSCEPRLFITHPDAYLQDYEAYETGWTWQSLREMSRVYPDVTDSQKVPEADALEEHWAWNEQLDDPPSAQTSMSLRQDRQRTSTSPYIAHFNAHSWRSSSPFVTRGPSPMLKSRSGSRPPHIRTASMPMSAPLYVSPATSRRRVVSNGQSRRSTPSIRAPSQATIMKRRRTRSPSHARFTPRWTASPSPMPMGLQERQVVRGTTPFAYATPFSNAPLQEVRPIRGSSVMHTGSGQHLLPEDDDDDDDYDIQIYESGTDESFDDGDSMDSVDMMTHAQAAQPDVKYDSQHLQLPEDEPWPGIEDRRRMSDGENIDPRRAVDHHSNASSQPSEYPSTQRAWPEEGQQMGFQIHEDEESGM